MISLDCVTLERRNISFGPVSRTFKEGECVAVMGENGAGKTTLLDLISGLETPSSGAVDSSSRVSYAPQESDDSFFLPTVLDEFSYSLRCVRRGLSVREEAERLLVAVGLDSSYLSQSPFSLSGGEKRLLSIALALAMSPDIILLDESLSGLDWKGYRAFRALVSSLKNSGIGIIFISHDPSILDLADALIVIKDGKIVFDGNPVTAMEDGLVKKSFAYSKSMELLGIPVLSLKEILRRVGNE